MFKTYFTSKNNSISNYSTKQIDNMVIKDLGEIIVFPSPRRNPFNNPLRDIKSDILEITQEIEVENQDTLVELEHQRESIKKSLNLSNINNYVLDTSSQIVSRIQSVTVNVIKYFTPSYYFDKKNKYTKENLGKDAGKNTGKDAGKDIEINDNTNKRLNGKLDRELDSELDRELDRELENEIIVNSSEDNFLDIIYRKIKVIKNNGLQMSEILDEQDEMIDQLEDKMDKNIDKSRDCSNKIDELLN